MATAVRDRLIRFAGPRYGHAFALLGLFLFHVINNWIWAVTNVTLLGWDRSSHLAKTLIYNDILRQIDIRSVFTALTWPWNRPPLPFLSVVPFYRLFGVSTDIALMSNCLYLGILLLSVYGIGRTVRTGKVGLYAAFLTSFYPILYGISRLSYVDYALTAMVSLSIYLLLKTDQFRSRKWSLLFGLGMGLGLLTKWPFIAFAGAPVAYVAWRSGALSRILFIPWRGSEGTSRLRRLITAPWFHIGGALLVSLAWYVPNWDRLPQFMLGQWLPVLSCILLAGTFYVLSRRPSQGVNFLSAVMLGASIASVWSLPNIGFSRRFLFVAYGGVNIQGKGLNLLDPAYYARYVSMLMTEQLSPLYFCALLLAVGALLYKRVRRSSGFRALWGMSETAVVLTLWFVVPFLIFTFSQTWNSRFNIGLLPAAALITAWGLDELGGSYLRAALVVCLVGCGLAQFFILSYDSLYSVSERTVFSVPVLGRMNLLGEGSYVMPPNRDRTDSGYWVGPQIMTTIRDSAAGEASLGLLVNNTHLNADILRYLTLLEFGEIHVRDLARDESEKSVYLEVFSCDYVLLSTGDPYKLSDGAKEAVARINDSPETFRQVFELRGEYAFPDGETLSLYGKRFPPVAEEVEEYYRALTTALTPILREGDAMILDPPRQLEALARFYDGDVPIYLLPQGEDAEDELALRRILGTHERIYAVFRAEHGVDPERLVEGWLNQHAYRTRDEWYGDVRLVLYASPEEEDVGSLETSSNANLADEITLLGYTLARKNLEPGTILRFTLYWQARRAVSEDYKVFAHLIAGDGQLMAQRDSEPVGGFRPTTTWVADEIVSDNYGVLIPEATAAGEYQLAVGMYLPSTGERLPVVAESGDVTGDMVFLDAVRVVAEDEAPAGEAR